MNKRGVILLAVLASLQATAQFIPTAHSAQSSAMGGCLMPAWNDSSLHLTTGWRQGFLTKGMSTRTISVASPLGRPGHIGGEYIHFGDVDYHEQQAKVTAALDVTQWLTVGVYGLYSHIGTSDPHYTPQHWLDAGISMQASASMVFVSYLEVGSRRWDADRPIGGRLGFTYMPLTDLTTALELSADERTRLRFGMEYLYNSHLAMRAGMSTSPLLLTFGVGYRSQHYHIDLATEVHSALGISPQISIGLCL